MSWGTESDNQSQLNVGNEQQWKIGLGKIDNCLKNIRRVHDDLKARFDHIQHSQLDMNEVEKKREILNPLLGEMTEYIAQLERMIPSTQSASVTAMKNQVKDIRRRAADLTMMVQKLCAAINTELYNRQMMRKKETSIISHELGYDESKMQHGDQMQLSTMDDSQIQIALEEQKQSEKIARDMITLESIFVRLSTMIHEQGEVVDRIEANVEDAYEKTEAGVKELGKAVDYKKSALKKKMCLIGIGVGVVLIIALIIGLSVGLKT